MIIGFQNRSGIEGERDTVVNIRLHSLILSELDTNIEVRRLPSSGGIDAATVGGIDAFNRVGLDALFATEEKNTETFVLLKGTSELEIETQILNDFSPEEDEHYTLSINRPDVVNDRALFKCNDEDDSTDYFCQHTIYIIDDDG